MALVLGTDCGFVTTTPTADPTDSNIHIDNNALAVVDDSPADAATIIEVGFWADSLGGEESAPAQIGLYSDSSGAPGTLLFTESFTYDGTTDVWISRTVSWAIDPSTTFWLAAAVDDSAVIDTFINFSGTGGSGYAFDAGQNTLPASFTVDGSDADGLMGIYAITAAAGVATIRSRTRRVRGRGITR